jgi:hypothetical protein
MLSVAKHPQFLFDDKQMQILRFAQDDNARDCLRRLLE